MRTSSSSKLRAGEYVQVRGREEILQTLDEDGLLEGLPFMPEMFEFCGRTFRIFKRAHKTCDPPNGLGGRRMRNAVHLEDVRCSGNAHGGCQARCLVFWKDAWLKKIEGGEFPARGLAQPLPPNVVWPQHRRECTEQDVIAATRRPDASASSGDPVFVCQSTQISSATKPLPWWHFSQYAEDYTSGNEGLSRILASGLLFLYDQLVSAGLGLGSALRWAYDGLQRLRGCTPYPWRVGKIPLGAKTPSRKLDLQPGELVKIRSYPEILATINVSGHNRGMVFDAEMVPYCGGAYRVLDRVTKIIDEKTGNMLHLKNDCIMLDGVVCRACYAKHRRFCPRSIYAYWREIWLERVVPETPASGPGASG